MKKFFIFSFLFFTSFLAFSFAQNTDSLYQNYTVKYSPTNIREGELIKFYIQSDDFNLSQSLITWSVNGKKIDEGVGRITFETNAGKVGKSVIVRVNVKNDIFEEDKDIIITPNTTFILYEGVDSYVPPFYKGRSLPSKEGTVRMGAISFENSEISDFQNKKNNYEWTINEKEPLSKEGENKIINKTTVSFVENNLNVKVRKSDNFGKKISDSFNTIFVQDIDPVIYKTDPKALVKKEISINEKGNDFYLWVEPFFFTGESRYDKNLVYNWTIDGIEQSLKKPWFVNIKGIKDKASLVGLKILQNKKITQEFEIIYKIYFN